MSPDHPPLTPAVFHVLLALAAGERHGYGIMKDVEAHTDGAMKMGAGTLYGTIQRLLDLAWAAECAATRAGDPRRRYYRITAPGRRALGAEVRRLDALLKVARSVKGVRRLSEG